MAEGEQDPQSGRPAELTPERRRQPRETRTTNPRIGRARLLAGRSHHYPSLRPNGWYKLIGENPAATDPRGREGYLWIEVDGHPRQVWAGHFEVERAGQSSS
jgi:hypothetical protein